MEIGEIIKRNGKMYEAISLNKEINTANKTNNTDPCTMCAFNPITCEDDGLIECITEKEFLYFKEIMRNE